MKSTKVMIMTEMEAKTSSSSTKIAASYDDDDVACVVTKNVPSSSSTGNIGIPVADSSSSHYDCVPDAVSLSPSSAVSSFSASSSSSLSFPLPLDGTTTISTITNNNNNNAGVIDTACDSDDDRLDDRRNDENENRNQYKTRYPNNKDQNENENNDQTMILRRSSISSSCNNGNGSVVCCNDDSGARRRRSSSVRFSTAEYRYYPMTIGDNPSVTKGVPLSLDWNHWEEATRIVPVKNKSNDYDDGIDIIGREKYSLLLEAKEKEEVADLEEEEEIRIYSSLERARILKAYGHTEQDIIDATEEASIRRDQLLKTSLQQQVFSPIYVHLIEPLEELWLTFSGR